MIKFKIVSAVLVLFCVLIPAVCFATFIENNTNLSAEWTRMQARAGSYDSMDVITYNPAGTVKMEDGLYLCIQNQFLPKSYAHEYNGVKYEADNTTFLVPGFFVLHKKGRWSQFGGVNVIGGGGTLEYENSIFQKAAGKIINLTPQFESVYGSAYMGLIAGASYAVNENISVSLGGRLVYGVNTLEIEDGDMLDLEKTATGFAPIVGINYSVNEKFNIGFRHEFKTSLEFEIDKLNGKMSPLMEAQGIKKGYKNRKDFPALTAVGITYQYSKNLKLAADLTYCWNSDVNWDDDPKGDNAFEISLGAEYALSERFKVSSGYSYVDAGLDVDDYSTTIGKNPYHLIAGGFMYSPLERTDLNFGVSKLFYDDKTDENGILYEKDLWIIGISLSYKFK